MYNQVLAGAPELLWIGNLQRVLFLGIAHQFISSRRVIGEDFGAFAVELDFLVDTDIDFREIILIEVAILQYITLLQDLLFFQLSLGAKHEPSRVQILILCLDGLLLLLIVSAQSTDVFTQLGDLLALLCYLHIAFCQLCL